MLKKLTLLTILLVSFTITTNAQLPISLDIYGGISGSAFENQESSATAPILGAAVLIDIIPVIDAGAEFNTTLSPFKFEDGDRTQEITQTYIGLFGRLTVLPLVAVTGYLRLGFGMYSGSFDDSADGKYDFKSAFGGNLGLGLKTMIGLYGEFNYHLVSREIDFPGQESQGYNNWMLLVGYHFSL